MASVEADLDYAIALSLQDQFNEEARSQKSKQEFPTRENVKRYDPRSVVDESWELTDPNPNIHNLFADFDDMFFGSTLKGNGVAVSWSDKMTLCAGVCSYEGRGGLCSVRLSQPLLKLRPRQDLVETLLHEMIHAYLFVTENNRDHGAHGPKFRHHMYRINKLTGANISVYHSFHNEVNVYRQHWWKCDGPCQKRPPYFGIVKRAMNRAPSPRDPWWAEHQMACGGTYVKTKEPEDYKKSRSQKKGKEPSARTVKGKDTSKNIKYGNIKNIFSSSVTSSSKGQSVDSRKSDSISIIKPFEGKSHRTKYVNTITIEEEEGDSMREKMLAAADRRRQAEEQRGVKRKFGDPTGWEKSSSSGPVSDKPAGYSLPKKLKLSKTQESTANDSVVLVDVESTPGLPSVKMSGSKVVESSTVDLTVDGGDSDRNSSVIDLDDEYHSDSDASSQSIGDGLDITMCPVCGRTDIPAVIINSHVAFCLDEDIESRTVDDDHL